MEIDSRDGEVGTTDARDLLREERKLERSELERLRKWELPERVRLMIAVVAGEYRSCGCIGAENDRW